MEHNCPAVHHRHSAGIGVDAPCGEITAWRECARGKGKFGNVGIKAGDITPSRFGTVDFRHIGFDLLHIAVGLGGEDYFPFTYRAHSGG